MAAVPGSQDSGDWFDQQGLFEPATKTTTADQSGGDYWYNTAGKLMRPDPSSTPPPTPGSTNAFTASSTSNDLLAALNRAGATPGSDRANAITKQYTDALGIGGQALPTPGFSVGQYDPTRQKIYLPGTDLKYDNGQWGSHPWSDSGAPTNAGTLSSTNTTLGQMGSFTPSTFTLPTLDELRATPGYQFAQDQGNLGIERKAAAAGGFGGGLIKDLATFNQGLADTTYQNAVGNSLNAFGANAGQQQFGANFGLAANNQAFGQGLANRQFDLGAQNQYWGQGLAENQNAYNQYNTNQNTAFNQWLSLANLGNPGNPYA